MSTPWPQRARRRQLIKMRRQLARTISTIPKKLTNEERSKALQKLATWKLVDGERDAIKKTFEFRDFNESWAFMSRTALVAETVNNSDCVCLRLTD